MMISDKRVIIIEGGLSGLTLSYLLQRKNLSTTILEAAELKPQANFPGTWKVL
jgi:2-polyprenyl-6-methoxyphenol hydroxylase-like FAD-dependent oxidoreductase